MTLTEIRAALDARGMRPLKQLGQNFLHDQIRRMADAIALLDQRFVVDVHCS